jgi:erythronate-4-phosphate dehydrogenase
MLRIIADDKIPFLRGVLEPYADISYLPGNLITPEAIRDADALLVRTRTKCYQTLLQHSKVKFIATATIGFDHIDTAYCHSKNIRWANSPGCNSASVQQYLASALMVLAKFQKTELKGKTIGIIGVGNVGSKVEKIARSLGMNILLNDLPRSRKEGTGQFLPVNELLPLADVVTLHVPLITAGEDKTHHLFNNRLLEKMKPGAVLINTSRGEVVDTKSLISAINNGRIATAILDVWENEPVADLQLVAKTLIATPHIAGYSSDGKANATAMIVQALSRQFGFPLTDWFPAALPEPEKADIFIDGKGKSLEAILSEAFLHTYNIPTDDHRFRSSPATFEQQRGNYPVRREFPAYTIHAKNIDLPTSEVIKDLGFKLINIT